MLPLGFDIWESCQISFIGISMDNCVLIYSHITSITCVFSLVGSSPILPIYSLYANGNGTDDNIDEAITSLGNLKDLESKMGKLKYTQEANEMTTGMVNTFLTKANNAFTNKQYKAAAKVFEKVYRMSPKDTLYLYYAASSAVTEPDYKTALDYYVQLKNLGYSGEQMNYYATNVETGEEENFANKSARSFSIKAIISLFLWYRLHNLEYFAFA